MSKQPTTAQFVEAYGQERQTNLLLEDRMAALELSLEDFVEEDWRWPEQRWDESVNSDDT